MHGRCTIPWDVRETGALHKQCRVQYILKRTRQPLNLACPSTDFCRPIYYICRKATTCDICPPKLLSPWVRAGYPPQVLQSAERAVPFFSITIAKFTYRQAWERRHSLIGSKSWSKSSKLTFFCLPFSSSDIGAVLDFHLAAIVRHCAESRWITLDYSSMGRIWFEALDNNLQTKLRVAYGV